MSTKPTALQAKMTKRTVTKRTVTNRTVTKRTVKHTVAALCHILLVTLFLAACQPIQPPPDSTGSAESAPAAAIPAPEGATEAVDSLYSDPEGLFTVPIPTNWTAEEGEGYVLLTSPDGIEVYALAVEAESAEAGIEQAWALVDPAFDLPQVQVFENPPLEGERYISIIYETGGDPYVVADGQQYEGMTYVLLVRGGLEAIQRRAAQIQVIASGLDILAAENLDLTGVEPNPITPELLDELEAYIDQAMTRFGIPGAAVALVQGDEIIYSGGFGVRDLGGNDPITPDTRMMIGSTSKTFTTLFMAQLVDEGVFDWDTPVVDILPNFALADPDTTEQITMENLVCACTGVPRRDLEIIFNYETLSAEDVIESLATFQTFTEFGEAFQYSNQMVAAAGYVAAAAAGGDYGNLYDAYASEIEARILSPIGMERTTLDFATVTGGDNYAMPHNRGLGATYEPVPLEWEGFVTPLAPAGAYWSTVEDMGRYLITQLNQGVTPDGTPIVSAENLLHTRQPQIAISAGTSYGLGWMVGEYHGLQTIFHGGNTIGFTSELALFPELDLGISVITNAGVTNPFNESVTARLLELLFDQVPEEAADNAAAVFDQIEIAQQLGMGDIGETVDPAQVETYLGSYTNDALGPVELRFEGDTLLFDIGEFAAEVRPMTPAQEEQSQDEEAEETEAEAAEAEGPALILYDSPLAGTPLMLHQDEDGTPNIVIGAGVVEYTFTPTSQ